MSRDDTVRGYYARWAREYIDRFGAVDAAHPLDRALVRTWAGTLTGPVLDAGCGPGQWTAFLADHGCTARGIDLVSEFVDHARTTHPDLRFDCASLDALDLPSGSLGGVLSWYSLIHRDPADVPAALDEFARVIAPGGGLLIGFFDGDEPAPFDHTVTTAHRWPVSWAAGLLDAAGFEVDETHTRTGGRHRPHAAITDRRR